MELSSTIKTLIEHEYNMFKDYMYANSQKENRDRLGQFFTPAALTVLMLECYTAGTFENNSIIDPAAGSGNLLAAAIIAGADVKRVFGNELDRSMVNACRERIKSIPDRLVDVAPDEAENSRQKLLQFQDWQIHRGDATDSFCLTYFGPDYKQKLEEHFLEKQREVNPLFPMLTKEQEEFLMDVD
jgi:SAM-dependent methyltransferase